MDANDSTIPTDDVSWADYCDALANEAWLESLKANFLTTKLWPHTDLRDDGKTAQFPAST